MRGRLTKENLGHGIQLYVVFDGFLFYVPAAGDRSIYAGQDQVPADVLHPRLPRGRDTGTAAWASVLGSDPL